MSNAFKHPLRTYIVFTFLLFWVLFGLTGLLMMSNAPVVLQTIMKNICAWSSTIVLIVFFKRLRPGESFGAFFRKQFGKVKASDFIIPLLAQTGMACIAALLVFARNGEALSSMKFVSVSNLLPLLIINITSGPTGEELGWRGYVQSELRKRHSLLTSAIFIGAVWGLWHFPLWLVSGYAGLDLVYYAASFMLGIVSFSVFIAYFYERKGNILVAAWIHFLFNILMQIAIVEDIKFITYISLLYFAASALLVLTNRDRFLAKNR